MAATTSHAAPTNPEFRPRIRSAREHDEGIRDQVRRLSSQQQLFERALAKRLGIDAPGLAVMEYLISTGPSTPTELASHLAISTAATTLVLNRLERAGHIRRDRHPTDGRKLIVSAEGRSADDIRSRIEPLIGRVERLVQSLAEEERTMVGAFLDSLISVYDDTISTAEQR